MSHVHDLTGVANLPEPVILGEEVQLFSRLVHRLIEAGRCVHVEAAEVEREALESRELVSLISPFARIKRPFPGAQGLKEME